MLSPLGMSSPPSCDPPVATHKWRVWTTQHAASSGSMQGFHSPTRTAVAGAGDHLGTMPIQQSPFPGPGWLTAELGRARVSLAPSDTGDPEQRLPDSCVGCCDACNRVLDPSWLPGSTSSREGSTHCSSVHPVVSVYAESYIAQDKQHLTKQTSDCERNL